MSHYVWLAVAILIAENCVSADLRTIPSSGLYVDDSPRALPIYIHCVGGEGRHLGWTHNGNAINEVGKCNVTRHRNICPNWIEITIFRKEYAGRYTCYNRKTGETANASIGIAPEFTSPEPRTVIAPKGQRVEMNCKVRDYVFPVANVTWFKEIGVNVRELKTGPSFSITSAKAEDSGLYYCQAHNHPKKGVATKLIHLTVYEPLTCTRKRVAVVPGKEISVQIVLEGTPFPSRSTIFAVPPWSIKMQQNNTFTVTRNVSRNPLVQSNQVEEVIRAYQTVASGIHSDSSNVTCTVQLLQNESNSDLDKLCMIIEVETFPCSFKDVYSKAEEAFSKLLLYTEFLVGCSWNGFIHYIVMKRQRHCRSFKMIATMWVNATSKCTALPDRRELPAMFQSWPWRSNQSVQVNITMPADSRPRWYCNTMHTPKPDCFQYLYCPHDSRGYAKQMTVCNIGRHPSSFRRLDQTKIPLHCSSHCKTVGALCFFLGMH